MNSALDERIGEMRSALAVVALMLMLAGGAAWGASIAPDKKIIEWGWDQPDTAYMRGNIQRMEKAPFDGVIFSARAWTSDGPIGFSGQNWGRRRFTEEELRPAMEDLRATRFTTFTENFLRLNVTPGDVDWFDPEFDAVIENARLAAKVAASGQVRGFMLDVEMYQKPVFTYRGQKYSAEKSFGEYCAKVRERGRQFMRAVQSEMKSPVLLMTFANSLLAQSPRLALEDVGYGLLPSFVDGMLEAAGPQTVIVDAYESAYPFREVAQFEAGRRAITRSGLKLSREPEEYRKHLRVGFGIWMDQAWRSVGWFPEDPEKNRLSPLEFEYALHRALTYTDRYVWVYSEQPNWWTGDKLPEGYAAAVRHAREPHDPAWRTARAIPRGDEPLVTAESQPGHDDETTFAPLWSKYEKILDLPKEWLFRLDPKGVGEKEKWYSADAAGPAWKPIRIGKFWEEQGYQDYDGVGWYRVQVRVPRSAAGRRCLLAFGSADETVVVYVNGQYAGKWGLLGFTWNEPFQMDVSKNLRPGEENLIVVRVQDSIGMGGLWKSVLLISPRADSAG